MNMFSIEINTASLKENAESVTETLMLALNKTNDMLPFMERTEKILPGISGLVNEKMSYDEIYRIIEKMIAQQLQKDEMYITERTEHFNGLAQRLLLKAVEKMTEMFSVEYTSPTLFQCRLGIFNPFPRSVLKKKYFLHYDVSDEIFLRASLHEINHMILFDKWRSMHNCNDQKEPDFPDTLWFLEELAIEPTLNDRQIQDIIPIKHRAYDSLKKTIVDGIPLTEHIQRIYDDKKSMEDFLDSAYNFLSGKNFIL